MMQEAIMAMESKNISLVYSEESSCQNVRIIWEEEHSNGEVGWHYSHQGNQETHMGSHN